MGRINQNITKRLYELLKNLSPENQDTLEDFENEEDDGEDAYVFYDELTNKEYFIDGVLVDDSELDN